jgi:hypothetical protein
VCVCVCVSASETKHSEKREREGGEGGEEGNKVLRTWLDSQHIYVLQMRVHRDGAVLE